MTTLTQDPWPEESPGVLGRVSLTLRADAPGDLRQLDTWGIASQLVRTASGQTVAALVTDGDLTQIWQDLARSFPRTGLWPVSTEGLDGDPSRPWLDQEVNGPEAIPPDPLAVLRQQQEGYGPAEEDDEEFAELVADEPWRGPLEALAPALPHGSAYLSEAGDRAAALLVVPCTRPADVPAVLGWTGGCNYDLTGGALACVLRSWEDRYGALLMQLGFDTVGLQLPEAPQDASLVEAIAREHYALCPDVIDQGAETMEAYLPAVSRIGWTFWWD